MITTLSAARGTSRRQRTPAANNGACFSGYFEDENCDVVCKCCRRDCHQIEFYFLETIHFESIVQRQTSCPRFTCAQKRDTIHGRRTWMARQLFRLPLNGRTLDVRGLHELFGGSVIDRHQGCRMSTITLYADGEIQSVNIIVLTSLRAKRRNNLQVFPFLF